jgi:hypothetical protein
MTARTSIGALALLTAALGLAACGGTNPGTQIPTQAPLATTTPATQAPAATAEPDASFPQPSIHSDVNLEKLIPGSIGGEATTTLSMSGDDFVGSGADSQLGPVLDALNKQPADLSVAFGGNSMVQIIAFQVHGVPGDQILAAFYNVSKTTLNATITDTTIAGKAAKKITPNDTTQSASYIYVKNDVVFSVAGAVGAITDAQLTEVFQKLP